MPHCNPERNQPNTVQRALEAVTPVRAAVFIALYGISSGAQAQEAAANPTAETSGALQEITVTATRRSQALEAVPYSMSVVSADRLAETGVTDVASLATEVPGLSMYEYGARLSAATVPIIRGVNATGEPTRGFRTFEQAPVGTYIGNSPIDGYYELDDLKQVEVLRGPQGTLYGAGTLAGAIRLIPNSPELNTFSGQVEGGAGRLDHSDGTPYTLRGLINVPLGETLAFRASAKYSYEPGFIDTYGLFVAHQQRLVGHSRARGSGRARNEPCHLSRQEGLEFPEDLHWARGHVVQAGRRVHRGSGDAAFELGR